MDFISFFISMKCGAPKIQECCKCILCSISRKCTAGYLFQSKGELFSLRKDSALVSVIHLLNSDLHLNLSFFLFLSLPEPPP